MRWEDVVSLAQQWPGVEEGVSYGAPSLRVGKKFLTRLRVEDNSAVLVGVAFDERDILVASAPDIFHYTAHYRDYPTVLARLDVITPDELRPFLYRTWRTVVGKRVLARWDARPGAVADLR